jgi:hypothetical protein
MESEMQQFPSDASRIFRIVFIGISLLLLSACGDDNGGGSSFKPSEPCKELKVAQEGPIALGIPVIVTGFSDTPDKLDVKIKTRGKKHKTYYQFNDDNKRLVVKPHVTKASLDRKTKQQIIIKSAGKTCARPTFQTKPLPEADPEVVENTLSRLEEVSNIMAARFTDQNPEELLKKDPSELTRGQKYVAASQYILDGEDNPYALTKILNGTSPEIEDSERGRQLVARILTEAEFPAALDGAIQRLKGEQSTQSLIKNRRRQRLLGFSCNTKIENVSTPPALKCWFGEHKTLESVNDAISAPIVDAFVMGLGIVGVATGGVVSAVAGAIGALKTFTSFTLGLYEHILPHKFKKLKGANGDKLKINRYRQKLAFDRTTPVQWSFVEGVGTGDEHKIGVTDIVNILVELVGAIGDTAELLADNVKFVDDIASYLGSSSGSGSVQDIADELGQKQLEDVAEVVNEILGNIVATLDLEAKVNNSGNPIQTVWTIEPFETSRVNLTTDVHARKGKQVLCTEEGGPGSNCSGFSEDRKKNYVPSGTKSSYSSSEQLTLYVEKDEYYGAEATGDVNISVPCPELDARSPVTACAGDREFVSAELKNVVPENLKGKKTWTAASGSIASKTGTGDIWYVAPDQAGSTLSEAITVEADVKGNIPTDEVCSEQLLKDKITVDVKEKPEDCCDNPGHPCCQSVPSCSCEPKPPNCGDDGDDGDGDDDSDEPDCPDCGNVIGDPHLETFDGAVYSYQGAGEFTLAETSDGSLDVQGRFEAVGPSASVTTAIAANVAGDTVSIYVKRQNKLFINGSSASVARTRDLPNGGEIQRLGGQEYKITWPDGHILKVAQPAVACASMDVSLNPKDSAQPKGLFGTDDGNENNEFVLPDGTNLQSGREMSGLYEKFGDSWRVTEASESYFDYRGDSGPSDFNQPDFPIDFKSIEDLPEDKYENAKKKCKNEGVTDPVALRFCIYDYAETGQDCFADSAQNYAERSPSSSTRNVISVERPPQFSREWVHRGYTANTNWSSPSRGSVEQTSYDGGVGDGAFEPSFYVNEIARENIAISGQLRVPEPTGRTLENGRIGIVTGYRNPTSSGDTSNFTFNLFVWSQSASAVSGGPGEGYGLYRIDGQFSEDTIDFTESNVTELATNFGSDKGFEPGVTHSFEIRYTGGGTVVSIDGNEVLRNDRTFGPGRFGFYVDSSTPLNLETVRVQPAVDDEDPELNLKKPEANQAFSSNIPVEFDVSDNRDGVTTHIAVAGHAIVSRNIEGQGTQTTELNIQSLSAGSYTIQATAFDDSYNSDRETTTVQIRGASCEDESDCVSGKICGSGNRCVTGCASDSDCLGERTCQNNSCQGDIGYRATGTCTEDSDCLGGNSDDTGNAFCHKQQDSGIKGGICQISCRSGDSCPDESRCASDILNLHTGRGNHVLSAATGMCLPNCSSDSDCSRDGFSCYDANEDGTDECWISGTGSKQLGETCQTADDCSMGPFSICRSPSSNNSDNFCTLRCDVQSVNCPQGYTCTNKQGSQLDYCVKKLDNETGQSCTDDGDCSGAENNPLSAVCLSESEHRMRGGYCILGEGAGFETCATGQSCPDGSHCAEEGLFRNDSRTGPICVKSCQSDSDCSRIGYGCYDADDNGKKECWQTPISGTTGDFGDKCGTGAGCGKVGQRAVCTTNIVSSTTDPVCSRYCGTSGVTCPSGWKCPAQGTGFNVCIEKPESGIIGDSCQTTADCKIADYNPLMSGTCKTEGESGMPGGHCTTTRCFAGGGGYACPSGSHCARDLFAGDGGIFNGCAKDCQSDSDCPRSGYVCKDPDNNGTKECWYELTGDKDFGETCSSPAECGDVGEAAICDENNSLFGGQTTSICSAECGSSGRSCPSGWGCADGGGVSFSATDVCAKKCSSDSDCPGSFECKQNAIRHPNGNTEKACL